MRISLSELCRGEIKLIKSGSRSSTGKGTFKIEAYPGDDPIDVASRLVSELSRER